MRRTISAGSPSARSNTVTTPTCSAPARSSSTAPSIPTSRWSTTTSTRWHFCSTGGLVYETDFLTATPKLRYNKIFLDRLNYADDVSAALRLERRLLAPGFLAYVEAGFGYEQFNDTGNFPFASEQDGTYSTIQIGGSYIFNPKLRFEASYRFRSKNAEVDFEAYEGHLVSGRLAMVLPRSTFLILDASYERQNYDGPDPFISTETRRDNDWRLALTYGLPLSALMISPPDQDPMPEPLRDVVISFTGSYDRSSSNVPNYDYDNWRA